MTASTTSTPQVSYLGDLFAKRFPGELPAEMIEGHSSAELSAAIAALLRTDGVLAPSAEAVAELHSLMAATGTTLVIGKTAVAVERQLKSLRAAANRAAYKKGAADFDKFLQGLEGVKPLPGIQNEERPPISR